MLVLILCSIVASIFGYFGSCSINFERWVNRVNDSKSIIIFEIILSIIVGTSLSLLISYFFENSFELSIVASLFGGLFSMDIVREIREILDKANEMTEKVVDKKIENLDKEEKQKE